MRPSFQTVVLLLACSCATKVSAAPTPAAAAPGEPKHDDAAPSIVASDDDDLPVEVDAPTDTSRAVCRMTDPTLAGLCHRALDPFAADDDVALFAILDRNVMLARKTATGRDERRSGSNAVREEVMDAGGPRGIANIGDADQVVGTIALDCRTCERATVVISANTRSGTLQVELQMSQPPRVARLQLLPHARPRTRPAD